MDPARDGLKLSVCLSVNPMATPGQSVVGLGEKEKTEPPGR
jgi:hypothetical protein